MCKKNNYCLTLKKKTMPIRIFFIVPFMSARVFTAITAQNFHAGITAAGEKSTGSVSSTSYRVD